MREWEVQGRQREDVDRADCLRSHRVFDILNLTSTSRTGGEGGGGGERMAELPSYPRRCLGVGLVVPQPLHTTLRPVRWGGVREGGSGLSNGTARLRRGANCETFSWAHTRETVAHCRASSPDGLRPLPSYSLYIYIRSPHKRAFWGI